MSTPVSTSQPIFITGADRSGTTLLYQLLGSHRNISMVRRTNLFRWFYNRHGSLESDENLTRALDELLSYQRIGVLHPNRETILSALETGPRSYGHLFDALHSQEADRRGKPRWADKSLHHEYHAHEILSEFPSARIIHMLRDPRDRFVSASRRYDSKQKSASAIAGRWVDSAAAATNNAQKFEDNYLVLRFEDLLTEPQGQLERVCAFLDEPFDNEMFTMTPDGADPENSDPNSSFGDIAPGTISTSPIGRYRKKLSEREVAFIEIVSRQHMVTHGYTPDTSRVRALATARPSIHLDALRTGAWRVRQRLATANAGPPSTRLDQGAERSER